MNCPCRLSVAINLSSVSNVVLLPMTQGSLILIMSPTISRMRISPVSHLVLNYYLWMSDEERTYYAHEKHAPECRHPIVPYALVEVSAKVCRDPENEPQSSEN